MRRALGYLETRSDVDHQRLAFYGLSMGAYYGPLVTAVEELFDSGHVPPYADVVRETLDWLDRYLGPVTTGPPRP